MNTTTTRTDPARVAAHAVDGKVLIVVDSETALDLMVGFQAAHETSPEMQAARPDWYFDVLTLVTAAAEAAIQQHGAPTPAYVPVMRTERPQLRLVPAPQDQQTPAPGASGEGCPGAGQTTVAPTFHGDGGEGPAPTLARRGADQSPEGEGGSPADPKRWGSEPPRRPSPSGPSTRHHQWGATS